jgi:hypothetical protein
MPKTQEDAFASPRNNNCGASLEMLPWRLGVKPKLDHYQIFTKYSDTEGYASFDHLLNSSE